MPDVLPEPTAGGGAAMGDVGGGAFRLQSTTRIAPPIVEARNLSTTLRHLSQKI